MARVTVKVEGLAELRSRMRWLSAEVNEGISRAGTNAAAQVIKKLAIEKAPVGPAERTPKIPPGSIRDNIVVRYIPPVESGKTSMHVVTVRKKGKVAGSTPYRIGRMQEFGTVRTPKQAFLRPAWQEGQQTALNAMERRIAARLKLLERKWGFT